MISKELHRHRISQVDEKKSQVAIPPTLEKMFSEFLDANPTMHVRFPESLD